MDKLHFITRLKDCLSSLTYKEIEDIVADYEEHFRIGALDGKSEDEIALSLGSPEEIARQYLGEQSEQSGKLRKSPDHFKAWVVGALLVAANVALFFTPLLTVFWCWVAFWTVSCGAIVVGIMIAVIGLLPVLSFVSIPAFITAPFLVLFGTGTLSLGILLVIFMLWISKYAVGAVKWWVKFNIDIAKKAGGINE